MNDGGVGDSDSHVLVREIDHHVLNIDKEISQ
jgi:hypothetical protein